MSLKKEIAELENRLASDGKDRVRGAERRGVQVLLERKRRQLAGQESTEAGQ